jgi:hypothetical protein
MNLGFHNIKEVFDLYTVEDLLIVSYCADDIGNVVARSLTQGEAQGTNLQLQYRMR